MSQRRYIFAFWLAILTLFSGGVGIRIGVTGPADNYGVFLYFSVEHKLF
jgi:hypothetical protein